MGNYQVGTQPLTQPKPTHSMTQPFSHLEREATLNPLHANFVFERLSSAAETSKSADNDENEGDTEANDAKADKDPTEEEDSAAENEPSQDASCSTRGGGRGVEQVMRVSVRIPHQVQSCFKLGEDCCHVIVVADASGSMAGNPWNQVKSALMDMVSTNLGDEGAAAGGNVVDVVTYQKAARLVAYTPENYVYVLRALEPGGLTSFVAAMDKVDEVMKSRKDERFASTVVMFMTDGQDSVSSKEEVEKRLQRWGTTLQACRHQVTVHAVGFSKDHDFKFLQRLSEAGRQRGLFRYCEPGDGPEMLRMKVQELFDFAVHSARHTVEVTVDMGEDYRIMTPSGALLPTHTVEGEIIQTDQGSGGDGAGEMTVQAEMWVIVPEAAELPSPVISLTKTFVSKGQRETVKLPCVCDGVEVRVVDDAGSKTLWGLNVLSRNTDALAEQIANAIQEMKDVSSLQSRLSRLQSRMSHTKVFGQQISGDVRASLLATMKEIQAKMDTMHSMMARYSRGETASVSILARAHDLRYEAQFKKTRRQRMMDTRAVKNVHQAKADEAKLENLTVDEAELSQLSQEAVDFFFCALSQESVVDILRDVANRENAIGFGLAVCRPEYIVDSPTLLQLCLVSGTLVSRSSMLDALEFKVNLSGQLSAHNGFNFFNSGEGGDGSMGYATVGMGREPINAWLPLYVTKSHWERVKVILKPSLGYLCTLDPLGFDWGQLDVPFAVLGAMIGQLTPATAGSHQLKLLFSFLRTCVALTADFNLTNRILNIVTTFLREPSGRFKNVLPNLHTLIGYIAALPVSQSRQILGYDEEGRDPEQLPKALWLAFLAEMLRRSGGSTLKSHSDCQRNILVDLLLHGRKNSLMLPGKAQEASCLASTQQAPTTTTTTAAVGKVQEASCLDTGQQTPTSAATPATGKVQEDSSAVATTLQTFPTTSNTTSNTNPTEQTTTPSTTTTTAAEKVQEARCSPDTPIQTEAATVQAMEIAAQHCCTHFTLLCSSLAASQDADLTIQGVDDDAKGEQQALDAAKGEKAEAAARAAVDFPHRAAMDSHMEVWARAELGGLESKSQEKKVSSARKQVALWIKEGRRAAGLAEEEVADTQGEELDCDAVDSSILEVTTKLLTVLSRSSHLPLSSVGGTMAFLHAWLSEERDLGKMDDGLPPQQWIDHIKAAVARVYSDMHEYLARCQQQVSADSVEEVLVVEGAREAEGATGNRNRHRHHQGKRGVDDVGDDDDDDDYEDNEDYGYLEEDDPLKVLKRRQQEHRSLVTLPMLLHALDPCLSKVKVTQAMLCQAVVHGPNTAAKDAVEEGRFVDLKEPDESETLMRNLHRHLVKVSTVDHTDSILWRRANVSLLAATNIWAFLGYLMNTYTERHEGFSWLLVEISELDGESSSKVPCLADKVKVMLTGRWQGREVLSRGNSIMPGKALSKKLETVLGELSWGDIDLELRGDLNIHVYRESDIPNRHGHCNSNPYIPPALRLRLGLPPVGQ